MISPDKVNEFLQRCHREEEAIKNRILYSHHIVVDEVWELQNKAHYLRGQIEALEAAMRMQ